MTRGGGAGAEHSAFCGLEGREGSRSDDTGDVVLDDVRLTHVGHAGQVGAAEFIQCRLDSGWSTVKRVGGAVGGVRVADQGAECGDLSGAGRKIDELVVQFDGNAGWQRPRAWPVGAGPSQSDHVAGAAAGHRGAPGAVVRGEGGAERARRRGREFSGSIGGERVQWDDVRSAPKRVRGMWVRDEHGESGGVGDRTSDCAGDRAFERRDAGRVDYQQERALCCERACQFGNRGAESADDRVACREGVGRGELAQDTKRVRSAADRTGSTEEVSDGCGELVRDGGRCGRGVWDVADDATEEAGGVGEFLEDARGTRAGARGENHRGATSGACGGDVCVQGTEDGVATNAAMAKNGR